MPPPDHNPIPSSQAQATQQTKFADWVAKTQQALAADPRAQPWKQTFGATVDREYGGEDWVPVRKEQDVQHNSS